MGRLGESVEVEIGTAAYRAGLAMLSEFKRQKALLDGFHYFAPIKNTLPNVQMIGVARLHYRPLTSRTRDWYGELTKNAPVWIAQYNEMQKNSENGPKAERQSA